MEACRKSSLAVSQAIWERAGGPACAGQDASFVDNVSFLRGKHAFKFGFNFMDLVYDNNSYNQANGQVKFKDLTHFL